VSERTDQRSRWTSTWLDHDLLRRANLSDILEVVLPDGGGYWFLAT
jgi:hypothetical protein